MALRYSAEFLHHLRDSPLCVKPENLPPAEEWMGPPAEQVRTQTKPVTDRTRVGDNTLLDQTNRRPGVERHISRNSANPEDIVFAPPRMAFASARGIKAPENDRAPEAIGRFGLRPRNGEPDSDRLRDGKPDSTRRRGDGDQDSDGWSTVKPRKSFGHEGAERFQGRMGAAFRDDRRPTRERDEAEPTRDRPARGFDTLPRERDVVDEGRPRNGGRSKLESWHRSDPIEAPPPPPEKRERPDRMKSWRDREAASEALDDRRTNDRNNDRNNDRTNDRRWGRDQRVEREPEWMDEPVEEPREAHTQQDFQKWMEQMKKAKGSSSSATNPAKSGANEAVDAMEASRPPAQSAPAVEPGPDKFFANYMSQSGDASTPGDAKDGASKARPTGKASRFTSFFAHGQEDNRRGQTEPPTPLAGPPVNGSNAPMPQQPVNAIAAALASAGQPGAPEEERQAFQQLLAKLQKQTMSATPPAPSPFAAPPQTHAGDKNKKSAVTSPEPFLQYGADRRDGPLGRPPSQHIQEIHAPRPQPQTARPEQLLQDLVGHHQRLSSQGSGRPEMVSARNNSNTEFLMNLMRAAPEAQRSETQLPPPQHLQQQHHNIQHQLLQQQQQQQQHIMRKQAQIPQLNEREPDFPRDPRDPRGAQRAMRPQPPPGFPSMDDGYRGPDMDIRTNQPTQILQRAPPPPGLDQMPPNWLPGAGQMPPPPQQRGPMMAPPGLAGGPSRNVPMPPHMFPPNFPGGMPPLEALGGMPPRNMPPPPPGFFNGPPHGFLPPGLGGFNGPPGPDSHVFAGAPFDGRGGMPPSGNVGRGANYGRP